MQSLYHVQARWDAEAGVWYSQSDVPGLVIETATLAEFEALMRRLAPEMLSDNGGAKHVAVEWSSQGVFEIEAA
jgi:hypothetical protein